MSLQFFIVYKNMDFQTGPIVVSDIVPVLNLL